MERYDVVVVGAGLAGLCSARWLAEQGRSILLVDRKSRIDQAIHTTGIFVRRTLEDFALPDDCLGPPVRTVKLYSPARRTFELSSPHDEFRVGKMGPLYQRLLQFAIQKGVSWSPATSFQDAQPSAGGNVITLESRGKQRSVTARYLIAADGANSQGARSLGLSQNREWIVGVEDVYDAKSIDAAPCLHCFLDPQLAPGYIAWIAFDGEEAHVGVGGYRDRFDPHLALGQFTAELPRIFPIDGAELLERRGGRIPVGGVLPNIVNDRGLLVGDAAGAVSPLTAGGLDPCLRQSALAVQVVDRFLTTGYHTALSDYESLPFRRRFRARCFLRRGLSQIRHPWLAELAFAGLRLFPFNLFARHIFFGRGSFPLKESELPTSPAFRGAG